MIGIISGQIEFRFQDAGMAATVQFATDEGSRGAVHVESRSREVQVGGVVLSPPLSRKEFDVLCLLYERQGEACSKDEIAAAGWPERGEGDVGDQEIEQLIRRLRVRLEPDPSHPRYLMTLRGYGYRLGRE